jgi:hypothetical protein
MRRRQPRHRRARDVPSRAAPTTTPRSARSRASSAIDLVVVGPEAPLVAGSPTSSGTRDRRLRAERRGGADRGLEDVLRRT